MTDKEIKTLHTKRATLKAHITRTNNYLDAVKDIDVNELKLRQARITPCLDEFNEMQCELEVLEDRGFQEEIRQDFETKYFSILTRLQNLIDSTQKASSDQSTKPDLSHPSNNKIQLPKISLPTFSGLYEDWLAYYDTFNSLIHTNTSIADIQKFHYLKSSLTGEAANILNSLSASNENYDIAWDMLKARYDNKRVIIHHHIKGIHELPILNRENSIILRQIVDGLFKHTRALISLNRPVEHWDDLLIYIITKKLDINTIKEWENTLSNPSFIPTLEQFKDFLNKKCQTLETISRKTQNANAVNSKPLKTASHIVTAHSSCPLCSDKHFIHQCNQFLNASARKRIDISKSKNLCLNCLRAGHKTHECFGGSCKTCKKKHNTLLHLDQVEKSQASTSNQEANITVSNHVADNRAQTHCLLSTALILIDDIKGKAHECRALLDCGSQSNFITKNLADRLGIKQESQSIPVVGINATTTQVKRAVNVKIKSRLNAYQSNIKCLILNTISSNLPIVSIQKSLVDTPNNIRLADPEFNVSKPIDMLLGVDIFWKLLCVGQIKSSPNQPSLQKTHFGWIIAGSINCNLPTTQVCCNLVTNEALDTAIAKFWHLEETTSKQNFTLEGRMCEKHFVENVKRKDNGRYIVKLPFKNTTNSLGNSYQVALKRFYNLERRLDKNIELKTQYSDFLTEYIELGHMTAIKVNPFVEDSSQSFYLPHHAVERDNSTTTKLRVVFDASCKSSSGHSLNDLLMTGPTIQQDLFSIITRFRTHRIALTADIAKMYRQILLDESDSSYQRILWRSNRHDEIQVYNLHTVTYGTSAAPFLAIRTLSHLALEESNDFPVGSKIVMRDFYVDDLITGAETIEQISTIINESKELLRRGGFQLRKWQSNHAEIFANYPDLTTEDAYMLDKSNSTKALGLFWDKDRDVFYYQLPSQRNLSKITKRSILSFISQLFDPLGLLGPVIIIGKILMQKLWQLRIDWDESTPLHINTEFTEYMLQFKSLKELNIPRQVIAYKTNCILELHGFCDASQVAYGACVYVKCINHDGSISCNLLCAKSKVAPIKSTTIPRLELCGALLLARLVSRIVSTIDIEFRECHYWTDSTIVLAWIKSTTKQWKTFVANRISEILETTRPSQWHHVKSENNPADTISRGVSLTNLIDCNLWWYGPPSLDADPAVNTDELLNVHNDDIAREEKSNAPMTCLSVQVLPNEIFPKFSSFTKLLRVTTYCFRFINNVRRRLMGKCEENCISLLTNQEIESSRKQLVRIVQMEHFLKVFKELTSSNTVHCTSKLLSLNPFIDDDGLIRVGGRLRHSKLPYSHKHPIVLPAKHEFTKLVIQHHHHKQLHAGVQGTMASIRSEYWPLSLQHSVKYAIRKCVTCFKAKPRNITYLMGDLPNARVGQYRPFLNSGVDFCGPFEVRETKRRNAKSFKIYVAIFICLSTKAIHIETVGDLTAEAFINTLKRFMARRGSIANLYSDNATNFTGARNEIIKFLNELNCQEDQGKLSRSSDQPFKWHFIPPRSPNFGGIWEAAVKSMKHHLHRIVGKSSVTYEQMQTLLIQIESILNSRPLTPISNDPNDESFLTPAHFLIGDTFTTLPEPDVLDVKVNRLSQWQHVEQLKQHFWRRWYKEYLHHLQERTKWKKNQHRNVSPGQMVIIKEDNIPPLQWAIGRVEEVHPGHDGVVRTASVQVKGNKVKRPVSKLCILPLETVDN